jgi:hypothetical protein
MAGLWGAGTGSIVRPSTAEMFFLPQVGVLGGGGGWFGFGGGCWVCGGREVGGRFVCLRSCAREGNTKTATCVHQSTTHSISSLPPPPQQKRPYCTLGSLRDQLHYPQKPGSREHRHANEDAELVAILEAVNLGDLPVRWVVRFVCLSLCVGVGVSVCVCVCVCVWRGGCFVGGTRIA